MKKIIAIAFLIVQLFAVNTALAQSEMELRSSIGASVANAFLARDYPRLESQATDFRNSKARTPSGLWKLTLFYVAIGNTISRTTNRNPNNFNGVDGIASEWVAKYPDSPTAHIVHSMTLYQRGTAYRGTAFAKDVDPAAWKPYNEFMSAAKANLEQFKTVASTDPEWYELMLMIGRAQSWDKDQFMKMLDEGLKREPGFYQTYFAALDYLLPKWSGSIPEIEAFAVAAAKRSSATEGSGMYARIYWYASQVQFGLDLFSKSMTRWPAFKKGLEDVVAKYPDSWNMNNFAKFSCLANDAPKTKELLLRIGPSNLVPQAWGSRELLMQCQQLAMQN